MREIITVSRLKKYYGEIKAVDGISFSVNEGELFGFLGVNGAGKSTTINTLCTLLKPTAGEATIDGWKIGRDDEKIRSLIGIVRQINSLDGKLTVGENLMLRGALYGMDKQSLRSRTEELKELLDLKEMIGRRYEGLSGGQKRRAEIAAALMNSPKILFLDEPTTGLDPATRKNIWEFIDTMRKNIGLTVFLTTHYMEEAAPADRIVIIDEGKIKESGTPAYLKEKYSGDVLRLEPKSEFAEELQALGTEIKIKNSMDALPVLKRLESKIDGFEVIRGTMDDVFLNVTGKVCEKA